MPKLISRKNEWQKISEILLHLQVQKWASAKLTEAVELIGSLQLHGLP